jgi:hypothetical protein
MIREQDSGPYYVSDVVNFVDEWRYYYAKGKLLCSWWYSGNEKTCEDFPHGPQELEGVPDDFHGAIDMGLLDTGDFAIVESQDPYAIGWYGEQNAEDIEKYYTFLEDGWKFLNKK